MPAADLGQVLFPFATGPAPSPVIAEPAGRPVPPSWRTRVALGARAVVVTFARSRDGATVRLEAQHDAPGAWAIGLEVRTRPMLVATVQSDAPERLHWALSARAPGGNGREFFGYALRWAMRKLAGDTGVRARRRMVEAALRPVLARAAGDALAVVDAEVRRAARPFAPPFRMRVASALARDRRGWLRQAAGAQPGAVLFALALFDAEETEETGLTLLHDLAEGRRLVAALDAALAAWSGALRAWSRDLDLWPRAVRGAFAAAAELDGGERARMLAAQRLLVRRAGPRCDPALLAVPPPVRFAPEDVPASPGANAAWFRVMKVPGVTVDGRPRFAEPRQQEAFAAFASRHAVALARPPRGVSQEAWLAELCEVLRASGRMPSRATDPARLVAQVDVEALRRKVTAPLPPLDPREEVVEEPPPAFPAEEVAAAVEPVPRADPPAPPPRPRRPRTRTTSAPTVTISPPIFARWSSERAAVVQLTTLRELRQEGARMHNCVADYRWMIERGELVVFTARVDAAPVTIAIAPWMQGWRLSEWKGFANRRLTAAEVEALRPWREAHGIGEPWLGA